MRCSVVTLRDPCNPGNRVTQQIHRRRRIRALAPRTGLPVIAYHNGRVILRNEWRRRVVDGDVVAFVVLPLGGDDGGSNPLAMVAMLAVMVFAPYAAPAMFGAEAAAMAVIGDITLGQIVTGAISIAGNALIGAAFAGKPSSPSPQVAANMAAASPTYNLQAQGNMARLDAAIPVQYGRMMAYPDFAAQPYAEFAGNEQYLYQLLCLGQGYYDIEAIRIEDTPISSFAEITYEIIEPGGALTLFPASVVTASEVTGQEALASTWLGPFVANAAGTTANTLAVDVVAPRGLYYANDSGGLSDTSITFTVEARTINDSGAPTGSYVALGTETLTAATNTPQRYSFRYAMTGARYEVRLQRTTAKGGTTRYADDLMWAGLRAYLPDVRTWPGQTLIALRMRASNNLSGHASRKINVIATRKLPIWNGSAWTAPQVTRSPAWAMADALRASYGGGLPDARLDTGQLTTLAATYAARGDTFDGRFDSTLALWEAVQKIGQAVRTRPYMQGGIVHFVRDEAASVPAALFSMRNIVRGSFSVDYLMPTDDTADAIDVGYFDGDVWSPRRVTAKLDGSAAKPFKVDVFGVTQRAQAYREGLYLAAVNRYRRKRIRFTTEMEGFIPAFGDLIAISHDMPAWGASGEVTATATVTNLCKQSQSLTVSPWQGSCSATVSATMFAPDVPFYTIAKTSGSSSESRICGSWPVVNNDVLTFSLALLAGTNSTQITLGLYDNDAWGASNKSTAAIISGPGTLLQSTGALWQVAGLSAVTPTLVRITRIFTGTGLNAWVYMYPDTHNSTTVGRNILATRVQVEAGSSVGEYVRTTTAARTAKVLDLSEPVTFTTGAHYIGLRKRDGSVDGPLQVEPAIDNTQRVVCIDQPTITPYTGGAEERTYFAFGKGDTWRQPARVVAVRPRSLTQVEIEAINEDASVHTADQGAAAPAAQYSQLPSIYTSPEVRGLTVRSVVGDVSTALVSWQAAPGARYYVIEVSSDGNTWSRLGETTSNNYSVPAIYGNSTLIRVAAFGFTLGPFVQVAYDTVSDYMWSAVDTTLMWSVSSSTLMWGS